MSQLWPCHIASSLYNNTFSGVVEFMLSNFCEVRGPFLREMPFWCNSYNGDIIILSFELIIFTCTVKILSFWVLRNSWFLWYLDCKSIYSNKILRVIFFLIFRRSVTYNQCLIPPQKKWMSLFSQCRKALGCNGDQDADLSVVWKSISVTLRSKWDSKLTQSEKEIILELLQSNSEMEQTARVTGDLEKLQSYLSKVTAVFISCLYRHKSNEPSTHFQTLTQVHRIIVNP